MMDSKSGAGTAVPHPGGAHGLAAGGGAGGGAGAGGPVPAL